MSGDALTTSPDRGATWNVLFLIGLFCAVPNLLFALFIAGWSSVAEHRAVPDGQPLPVISPFEAALYYVPAMVILGLALAAVALRWSGRRKDAGLLSLLQILAFPVSGAPLLLSLI